MPKGLNLMNNQDSFQNQKTALDNAIKLGINQLNDSLFVDGEASKQKMLDKINDLKS